MIFLWLSFGVRREIFGESLGIQKLLEVYFTIVQKKPHSIYEYFCVVLQIYSLP